MGFSENIKAFSERISDLKNNISTEEATKMSLVIPFFSLLGWDVFNPSEFCPEYTADVGIKKGEKVDYAIFINNEPEILIECKYCGDTLEKHSSQLFRYFGTTSAKFGILTNGIVYKFYTDLDEVNKMDLMPFLEIDLLNLKDAQINELKKFSKDSFDKDNIFSTASELKYTNLVKDYFSNMVTSPSDEFTKLILSNVYDGLKTQKIIDKFKPIIKKSLTTFINDLVNEKISSALNPKETDTIKEEADNKPDEEHHKIITTQEELEGYYIVRAILAEITNINDITYRDTESYFGILFSDNNRKPICRLNFDRKIKQLLLPDINKNFSRVYIDNISDIYKYKNEIIEIAKRYL